MGKTHSPQGAWEFWPKETAGWAASWAEAAVPSHGARWGAALGAGAVGPADRGALGCWLAGVCPYPPLNNVKGLNWVPSQPLPLPVQLRADPQEGLSESLAPRGWKASGCGDTSQLLGAGAEDSVQLLPQSVSYLPPLPLSPPPAPARSCPPSRPRSLQDPGQTTSSQPGCL